MADHVDANPTKGAGKSPRVPRTTRRASYHHHQPNQNKINHQTTTSSLSSTSTSTTAVVPAPLLPQKRKSRTRESNDLRGSKVAKVEEHQQQPKSSLKKGQSSSSLLKKKKEESATSSSSTGGRYLRKRKLTVENISSESDTEEVDEGVVVSATSVTTDSQEERASGGSKEDKGEPRRNYHHLHKPKQQHNQSEQSDSSAAGAAGPNRHSNSNRHTSSSVNRTGGTGSKKRNPSGASGSGGSSNINKTSSQSNLSSSSRAPSSRRGKVQQPQQKQKSSSGGHHHHRSAAALGAEGQGRSTTTSDSQESAPDSVSIASRLRLTPSRAAAAAQNANNAAATNAGAKQTSSSNNPVSSSTVGKSKHYSRYSRSQKKKSHKQEQSAVPSHTVPVAAAAGTSDTDELTEDQEETSKSRGQSSSGGFRYQLRSRASVDSSSQQSKSNSTTNRKGSGSSPGLKGAQILSEKERNLRRSSNTKGGGGDLFGSSGTGNQSSSSSAGGSGTQRGANNATSNTTGSCASSRCGRGGGPSSAEGPSSGSGKSGEPGMNNPSSSGNQQQSTSSSSSRDQADGGGAAQASSAAAGGGAAAATAFSRGLAMLSGDPDADEGEMGRLQALLESRGLPPHLFGSLAPRMQQLLHRGISNSTVTKAQQLLTGLQASGDEGQQLQAAIEMCQLLVMGNEDTLAGFPVKQTVPALIQLLSMEHNFDIMNHACRALTYMMEALPRSTPVVAEAVPVFLEKLQVIQCMDVAEQSLTALEMLSRRHAKGILQARGVSACLTYLDFFSIVAQRAALSVTANCCTNLHSEEFHLVGDSLPFLASRLTQQDKKSVESVGLAFSRLVDSFNADPKRLEEIASPELLANLQQLLVVTPPVVSTGTFILVLRMLAMLCARSPIIAVKLLEQNIVGTLSSLLLGSSSPTPKHVSDDVELVARNPQELLEIVALIAELLPKLPKDGIFIVNTMMANPHLTTQDAVQWQWKDDRTQWNSYSPFDSRIIEAAHQSGEDEISLSMQGRTYTVDFLGMQQINEDTGTARTVQRKVNPFFCLKTGGTSLTSESQDKSQSPNDERSSYLAVHPDFPLQFLRPLFALLSEANSSSAGPAVRQNCLKTLLRIVHFLPSESLQKVLRPQLVSNNLASMLGSSDLKIVVGAFQLCCLFMEKLHEEFLTHFRREGVFHQISRISTSEVVGPSPMKSDISAILGMASSGSLGSVSSAAAAAAMPAATSSSSSLIVGGLGHQLLQMSNNLNNVSGSVVVSSSSSCPSASFSSMPVLPSNTIMCPPNNVSSHSSASSSSSSAVMTHLNVNNLPPPIPPPPLTPLQNQMQMINNQPMSIHVPHQQASLPYSLCVGGFFMQQPGLSSLIGAASGSNQLLPPPTAAVHSSSAAADNGNNSARSLMLDAAARSIQESPIINVQPIGGNVMMSSLQSVITSAASGSGGSALLGSLGSKSAAERGGSGTSGSESTASATESSSGSVQSGSKSSAGEKKQEESHPVLYDAFKRKRVSKRPIPTSTSRRLRQEDPNAATSPNSGSASALMSSSSSASATTAQMGKRGSKSGFFASLHPSRWTRGGNANSGGSGGASGSSSNNNLPGSGGVNSQSDRSHGNVHGHPSGSGVGGLSSSRSHNVNSVFAVSYKEQVKSWLKEQSTAFTTKYCRNTNAESPGGLNQSGATVNDETGILPKLSEIIIHLRQESKMVEALRELRTILVESDISSFEVNHSGLIGALLGFLTDESGYKSSRDSRLRSFVHVFAECPLDRLNGEELDAYIGARSGGSALSSLVAKLNSCLAQLEQFQVKVHEVPTSSGSSRAAPTSALRFFNTHQLKCTLQRHPGCSTLRQWKGGPVKIDSLALVQTIERYLIAKGFGRIRESRDSGDSEDDNSDDDIDDTLAAAVISQGNARHKLQFLIGEHVLPYNMTVYQAIRQFGLLSVSDPSGELEGEFDPASALLGSSGIWAQTHTIHYRPVPEDGGNSSAANPNNSANTTSSSSKSKKSKAPSVKHTGSKSKKDPLWHEGYVSEPSAPYLPYLTGKLPESISISDPCLPVLTLLRVIHSVCRFWRYLYWPVLSGHPLLPQNEFINTKVAAKAQRQLQDPVVIMTGNVPQWLQQIGVICPFLFPFETRQMLFYSVTFDRDRALQRLLDSVPELNSSEREDRVTPRLDRRKRTISRDNILQHAEQLMSDFGSSRPLLEIQYENEVGTGLGPTLEFYALVSQELQKKELDLWHCESSVADVSITNDEGGIYFDTKSKSYVHTSVGLFPKPLGKSVKASQVAKVKNKFKFMGKFMAKAVMDSRMIDLPLSKTLYKWVLSGDGSMCLADISDVDSTVARSIRQLVSVVSQKKKLETKTSSGDLNAALESLTLDGCRIDNLGLDFTLPGHPSIDLKKGGKDIPVTIHNLEDYIKLVCHWVLVCGVARQMDSWKEGFDSVFPSSSLKMFYPEELEMIFCGANQSTNENWDVKTLMECCRADHGYTLESRAIQFLFEIMASYDAQERRKFIQFVTGSPRLPVGGFKSLQPPLTIVRKTVEGLSEADTYLPSVMTCVNYLKLPDYSTQEIMRERLRVAVDEGQLSFHLS